ASHVLVQQIVYLGAAAGLAPNLAALLLAPIATELPEVLNAVIWTLKGKERLALANISGAMMIQATLPTAMAISTIPWWLTLPLLVAAGFTLASIGTLWLKRRGQTLTCKTLAGVAVFYGLFAVFMLLWFSA